jgi:hypothetical protein
MVAAACSVQMKTHLEDLGKVPDRHELETNKGNQKTMKHDVFFETLTLSMNDHDFTGELPFHDDHLDGKDGKPVMLQHRDTWTVSQVRQNFSKLESLHAKALQHYNRSDNQNGGCFCGCDTIHPPANVVVYVWYAAGHHDPLFADKGTKLLKADCRFSGTVELKDCSGIGSCQTSFHMTSA